MLGGRDSFLIQSSGGLKSGTLVSSVLKAIESGLFLVECEIRRVGGIQLTLDDS